MYTSFEIQSLCVAYSFSITGVLNATKTQRKQINLTNLIKMYPYNLFAKLILQIYF